MPDTRLARSTTVAGSCPPWCTIAVHRADDPHHQGLPIVFTGPGDESGYFDQGEPYEVLWAALTDGADGPPQIYLDTLDVAAGAHLDLAGADEVLRNLRCYVARFEQLRNQLAELTTAGEQG